MNWDFIIKTLKQLGFDQVWVGWVKECVSTVSMSVNINGSPQESFKTSRGLRQGDPLSPYLFIIGMEVLSWMINQRIERKEIGGITLSTTAPALSHMFFADDIFLFGKASMKEAKKIKDCLDDFSALSGQMISATKSSISKNTSTQMKRNICNCLGLRELTQNSNYVGLPLLYTRQKQRISLLCWRN